MTETIVRKYSKADEDELFDMIRNEGPDWKDYWGPEGIERYKEVLAESAVFVAYDGDGLCGYARCRRDGAFGVYIYDLLVTGAKRGNNTGRALMDKICSSFPGETVYAMSDVDGYYKKQGYREEGRIFMVRQ